MTPGHRGRRRVRLVALGRKSEERIADADRRIGVPVAIPERRFGDAAQHFDRHVDLLARRRFVDGDAMRRAAPNANCGNDW